MKDSFGNSMEIEVLLLIWEIFYGGNSDPFNQEKQTTTRTISLM